MLAYQLNPKRRLPVILYIYGGGFISGSSQYEDRGSDFLLDHDIVFVSFNYRLGPLGFLSTEDMVLPGNNGLKDQLLALKWVKNNIHSFGGNPDEITIMGQSAGSASVSSVPVNGINAIEKMLLYHTHIVGLYKRAAMLSGVTLNPWTLARNPRETAFQIGSILGIQTNSSQFLISALSILPAELIILFSSALVLSSDNPLNFILAPVKEPDHPDSIFSDRSYRILSNDKLNPEDILMGFTSAEGISFIYTNDPNNYIQESFLVPPDMHIENQTLKDLVKEKLLSDSYFVRGIVKYMKLGSVRNKIFAYEFSYMGKLGNPGTRIFDGVGHAEDAAYLFKHRNEPSPIPESDVTARLRWVEIISNFAKYGTPTPASTELLQNIIWDPVPASGDLLYLDFDENLTIKSNPLPDRMLFWDDL